MDPLPNPISFRLPPEVYELLEQSAAAAGTTINKYAQGLVIEALTQPNRAVETADLESIHREIKKLREDFATAMVGQFVIINKALPEARRTSQEKIEAWVRGVMQG